ncbi:hypothetical protein [Dermacoccus nishinomiyaensis]|uniref:hypothetical protein n=1 Tax=Dermacoccus nishinomiyaensis TaxID=1274 RepID=UPI00248E5829|nr:hypothetical protein [Dermacoccus nishinomiyaensis]
MTDTAAENEIVETDEQHLEPDAPAEPADEQTVDDDADAFPRAYVDKLRKEAADARVKAKDRDDIAARLHTSLVAASGRLADPSDLPFDEAHLSDPDALTGALDELLARKPHLASRRPVGDIGQGVSAVTSSVDLAGILRHNAN